MAKQIEPETRFRNGIEYTMPTGDQYRIPGYRILGAAHYFLATPFVSFDQDSIRAALVTPIVTGNLQKVIAAYIDARLNYDEVSDLTMDLTSSSIKTNNGAVSSFLRVQRFKRPGIFSTLGFSLYTEKTFLNPEQQLIAVHLERSMEEEIPGYHDILTDGKIKNEEESLADEKVLVAVASSSTEQAANLSIPGFLKMANAVRQRIAVSLNMFSGRL